jgi:hypothetical protein
VDAQIIHGEEIRICCDDAIHTVLGHDGQMEGVAREKRVVLHVAQSRKHRTRELAHNLDARVIGESLDQRAQFAQIGPDSLRVLTVDLPERAFRVVFC